MDKKNNFIDKVKYYFSMLKLDDRASQKEVELAYETLTKDKDIPVLTFQGYREAFEFLMREWFCVVKPDNNKEEKDYTKEDLINAMEHLPSALQDALNFSDNIGLGMNDEAKSYWVTQHINPPLFFKAIYSRMSNIFGIKFWTDNAITEAIKECCLNPLSYNEIYFSLHYTSNEVYTLENIKELQNFVTMLKKTSFKDELTKYGSKLCPIFDIECTKTGIIGHIVAEKMLAWHLNNMLKDEAIQVGCCSSISSDFNEEEM